MDSSRIGANLVIAKIFTSSAFFNYLGRYWPTLGWPMSGTHVDFQAGSLVGICAYWAFAHATTSVASKAGKAFTKRIVPKTHGRSRPRLPSPPSQGDTPDGKSTRP
jgi:hypothetical protein